MVGKREGKESPRGFPKDRWCPWGVLFGGGEGQEKYFGI